MKNEAWMTLLGHIFPKSSFFLYSSSCFIALTRQRYAFSPLHLDTRQWLKCLLTKAMFLSLWKLTETHLPSFVHLNITAPPWLSQGLPGSFCWTFVQQSGKKAHCTGKHERGQQPLSLYGISSPILFQTVLLKEADQAIHVRGKHLRAWRAPLFSPTDLSIRH